MNNIMHANENGPGELTLHTDVPDGIYGSFALVCRIEIKDGKIVSLQPDGVDYAFYHDTCGDDLVIGVTAREVKDRIRDKDVS
jgi:hypothetical protein